MCVVIHYGILIHILSSTEGAYKMAQNVPRDETEVPSTQNILVDTYSSETYIL